jgi:predicted secreted protein
MIVCPSASRASVAPADSRLSAFAKSQTTWRRLKAKCGGDYSYKVRWSSWVGFGHETEIICRRNKVVERKYREWKRGPQLVRPGVVSKPQGTGWTETGDKIGSHKKGAPPKTLDQLYQEARKVLSTKLTAHQRLYVRYDKQGLLQSCFWVDTRIADDAPRTGVMISSLTLGKPGQGDRKPANSAGGRAINLKIGDSGKTVKAVVGDLLLIKLQAKPSTGYAWSAADQPKASPIALQSKKFLRSSQMFPEMTPTPNEGGQTTFTYRVVRAGKATISLTYGRLSDKKAKSAKTFAVTIEASKKKAGPTVTGTIKFSAPPDVTKISRIVVSIRKTAMMDGPAPLIGTVELSPPFKLPVTFAVPYAPEKVEPNPMFYSLSARVYTAIGARETLYYINDTHHGIFRKAGDTRRDVAVKKLR